MAEQLNKLFTIFISSTFMDLKEYREAARSAIMSMRNHVNDMFYCAADEREPATLSMDEVRSSDLIILIVAHRYGTIPSGETRSITEMEFDAAMESNIPVLAFFIEKDADWATSKFEWQQYEKLLAFKTKIEQRVTTKYFTTRDSLAAQVTTAIANFDKRHRSEIWTAKRWTPTITAATSKSLDSLTDFYMHIGEAEDGLPLLLEISRSDSLNSLLSEIAKLFGTLENSGIASSLDSYLNRKRLLKDAEEVWKTRGIFKVSLPSGAAPNCYVTKKQ